MSVGSKLFTPRWIYLSSLFYQHKLAVNLCFFSHKAKHARRVLREEERKKEGKENRKVSFSRFKPVILEEKRASFLDQGILLQLLGLRSLALTEFLIEICLFAIKNNTD